MSKSLKLGKESLRRRARRFLSTDLYGRIEVRDFCTKMSDVGDVAIFGGMLRDLSLEGNVGFSSDVDLVIDSTDLSAIENVISNYRSSRTAFGGHRIQFKRWSVDVWPLQLTWAIRNGHVTGDKLADLTNTTFFNWDAIVYDLSSGLVHCSEQYFDELEGRLLTINLASNPNPEGAAIRALKMAVTKRARLSYMLAEYTADVLDTVGVEALSESERTKHKPVRASSAIMVAFLHEFKKTKAEGRTDPIALRVLQTEFGFSPSKADLSTSDQL